jgi:hypothetical protein
MVSAKGLLGHKSSRLRCQEASIFWCRFDRELRIKGQERFTEGN